MLCLCTNYSNCNGKQKWKTSLSGSVPSPHMGISATHRVTLGVWKSLLWATNKASMTVFKKLYEARDVICHWTFPGSTKHKTYSICQTGHKLPWVLLCEAGLPRVEVIMAGKQGGMRIRNRLVISSFPKFTGHSAIATLGTYCALVKTINETDRGKKPE